MERLTWKCHVCKDERPDDKISVLTTTTGLGYGFGGITMSQNVRYCNDRPDCIAGAHEVRFIK